MSVRFLQRAPAPVLLCAALALFVFFSRAWLIDVWGSPLPFFDQWDAEASALFLPWLRGDLDWDAFFRPHNEHRIALTRLADLLLLSLSGYWNVWGQLFLIAVLHAATAAIVVRPLLTPLAARSRALLLFATAIFFSSTGGWQNALWGFQSQFAFSNLLSIAAIVGTVCAGPFSPRWCFGAFASFLVLFTNGGGVLASGVAFAFAIPKSSGSTRRSRLAGATVLGLIVLLGLLLRVDAPHHHSLRATNLHQFLELFSRCLAWPWIEHGALALVIQVPLALLLVVRLRQRTPWDLADRCALGFGGLTLLHAAAIGYSRGAGLAEIGPLSRYLDAFLPGAVAQVYALLQLAASATRPVRLLALGWAAIAAAGLIALTEVNLTVHLPRKRLLDRIGIEVVRTYVATGNAAILLNDLSASALHPFRPQSVRDVLDEPLLLAILPPDLRAPADSPLQSPPVLIEHGATLALLSALVFCALNVIAFRCDLSQRSDHSNTRTPSG